MSLKDIIINESGYFGEYGGRFVPELLVPIMDDLNEAFFKASLDEQFLTELQLLYKNFIGRPSPFVYLKNISEKYQGAQVYLKNEGANHTGAHKINHVIGQVLLAKRMGKKRIIAETGAGQHGLATATACAKFQLPCTIYMGEKDYLRQRPNVFWMELLGAEVKMVCHGDRTLRSAITEAFKDLISDPKNSHYLLGTACGPRPYPAMNVFFQKIISTEIKMDLPKPTKIIAAVGGGSNALGAFYEFLDDLDVKLIAIEAGGKSNKLGDHAIRIGHAKKTIFEGFKSYFLVDEKANMGETHSISAGMDYGGISPQMAYLADHKRVQFESASDEEALSAVKELANLEGIIPALESSHAVAASFKHAALMKKDETLVINCSGRGEKDFFITMPKLQKEKYSTFIDYCQRSLYEK